MSSSIQVREAFELMCHIDMTRYRWNGIMYVHSYAGSRNVPAGRVNNLYEGFVRGADWQQAFDHVNIT